MFITVDTEVWPNSAGWPHVPLASDRTCASEISRYLFGGDERSGLGLPFQLGVLRSANLKATYFVDPMFSYALGLEPLRRATDLIASYGQEIGLHLHPEWLTDLRCKTLPAFRGPLLHEYPESSQCGLVEAALARLGEAGARRPCVFRAGSWGASAATMRALEANGIAYDTSFNPCFPTSFPAIADRLSRAQPFEIGPVWEFPVTIFSDGARTNGRPLHVCAASLDEFRHALGHAVRNDWYCAVIVLHSFEFVRAARGNGRDALSPQRLLARRFESLCRFLSDNSRSLETCHFADIDRRAIPRRAQPVVAVSSLRRTAVRNVQQLLSRVY